MTIKIRKSQEWGFSKLSWLDSKHTFSFADYYDEQYKGFATHPHYNMEIISYVLDGALEHKDSMGNGFLLLS